jgi:hypothetical protein
MRQIAIFRQTVLLSRNTVSRAYFFQCRVNHVASFFAIDLV